MAGLRAKGKSMRKYNCIEALVRAGISFDDATALRRIAMTLSRWHEGECGDSNAYASWSITRGKQEPEGFVYDDDGKPFKEIHWNKGNTQYVPLPDREKSAKARLAAIMARYPGFASYIQGDPRGASLYILSPDRLARIAPDVAPEMRPVLDLSARYSDGIAVCK